MAFLVMGRKMKKNLKNSVLFILAAAIVILVLSVFLASSGSPSAIDVKATTTSQGDNSSSVSSKPQAEFNDYENAVAAYINDYRVANGLNAIAYEPTLTYIAKFRSQDLIDRNYWSHYTPEGTTVFNLFKENGVKYKIGGENLGQATPADVGTPEAFMNAWKNSPSHNANMLRVGYNYIGVGMVENGDRIVVATVFTN
jgi:uncharacterized protein YkwD